MLVNKQMMVAIDFHSMEKIQWKAMATDYYRFGVSINAFLQQSYTSV